MQIRDRNSNKKAIMNFIKLKKKKEKEVKKEIINRTTVV